MNSNMDVGLNMEKKQYDFEVLIASLDGDADIYQKSNLHCHCLIANQTDNVSYYENDFLRVINTNTLGVGKNRNIALLFSNAQYILFGDDDIKYVDDLENIVTSAFERNKKADILIFNIETIGSDLIKRRINKKCKRVTTKNYMNYGAVRIACKSSSIKKKNIWFSELFGGGARYGSGEDTKFLADCLRNKLKIYTVPINIGVVDQSDSTWFNGYTEKYFMDKGALLKSIYPKTYRFFCLYFALKLKSKDRGIMKIYSLLVKGAKGYKNYGID